MADVAADLRAALLRALGPIDPNTLSPQILDHSIVPAIRTEATRRLDRVSDDADKSRLLGVRSVTNRTLRDLTDAESDAKQALDLATQVDTELLLSPARSRLAQAKRDQGDYAAADRLFAMAETGELPRRLIGQVRAGAALSCIAQKRLTEALQHLEHAIEHSNDDVTTETINRALGLVYQLAADGFGPSPRPWEERAEYPAPRRFQDPRNGKWGFLDSKKNPVIPPTFTDAGEFRGGTAAVKERSWGAVDTSGALTVPFLYDALSTTVPGGKSVTGFVDGVAAVKRRGSTGLINRNGKIIVPLHYREIIVHPAGYAVTTGSNTWGARDRTGDEILPPRFSRTDVLRRLDSQTQIDYGPL
ncbi:MAG TPA: WG repeat-containing protein [Candidatus Stackebrandtia faecavium]|nr:WG repeat-containing protein [Candidatus Stackebrandtia faecavium]